MAKTNQSQIDAIFLIEAKPDSSTFFRILVFSTNTYEALARHLWTSVEETGKATKTPGQVIFFNRILIFQKLALPPASRWLQIHCALFYLLLVFSSMIESTPSGPLSPVKSPKIAPGCELLQSPLLFSKFCRSGRPNVDFWPLLLKSQKQRLDEATFRKNQEILRSSSLRFQERYFLWRYRRSRIPRSVYKGHFSIETTPNINVEDLLREIKKENLNNATRQLLSKIQPLAIAPDIYTLKDTKQCYILAYKAIRHIFDNSIHCTSRGNFRVNVIGEPVPVLFFLSTLLAPSVVIRLLISLHDEFEYETRAPNEYFVLVFFRSSNRPKPFCTKESTLCYLTPPLRRRAGTTFRQPGSMDLEGRKVGNDSMKIYQSKKSGPLVMGSRPVEEGTPNSEKRTVKQEKKVEKVKKAESSPINPQQLHHEDIEEKSILKTTLEMILCGHSPGSMYPASSDLPEPDLAPHRKFQCCRRLLYKMNWNWR